LVSDPFFVVFRRRQKVPDPFLKQAGKTKKPEGLPRVVDGGKL
jgi:hypothetical protein